MTQFVMHGVELAPAVGAWLRGAVATALASRGRTAYDSPIPEKEGIRLGRLHAQKRTDRAMRFFYVRLPSCVSYERRWRGSLRACWFSFVRQSTNPAICRSPRLVAGRGLTAQKEATMSSSTRTPVQTPQNQTALDLLTELRNADQIIRVMLNAMTPAQQSKVYTKLDALGVTGEGMSRYHERQAVITAAALEIANTAMRAGAGRRQEVAAEVAAVTQSAAGIALEAMTSASIYFPAATVVQTSPVAAASWDVAGDVGYGRATALQKIAADLCVEVLWLRSWWASYRDFIAAAAPRAASKGDGYIVMAAASVRALMRKVGVVLDEEAKRTHHWPHPCASPARADAAFACGGAA